MSKYVILYRIIGEHDGCRYIELNSDGTIHLDYSGKPIVSNARCSTRINEDFEDVETWVTEDAFNRLRNYDKRKDTFSDVADMIANGEHKEFEAYIRESELEMICNEYNLDKEDVEEIIDNYQNNDYFDMNIIANVWSNAYDIAENYIDEYCRIQSWLKDYIDYDSLGEAITEEGYYYELDNGRVVEYRNFLKPSYK